ncbi:GNAT family N-acetyltransferase [Nanoarchaeota archaeon]
MKLIKINGKKVYIRPLHKSDFESFAQTRESKEFRLMCGASIKSRKPSLKIKRQEFDKAITKQSGLWFAIIRREDNKYIGHCRLHSISKTDKNAKLAIGLLGDYFGKSYGTDAIKCLLKFGFKEMNLHKIMLIVLEFNKRAIAAYKKCGFKKDGILRDNVLIDGKYHHDVVMSILDSDFK